MFKLFRVLFRGKPKPRRSYLTAEERKVLSQGGWPYRPTPSEIAETHRIAQENDQEWYRVFGRD